ncbi:MAG: 2'-5' RNA ligase family protein [Victivallales bacterium]|jgi:2'-5' RNA ligase
MEYAVTLLIDESDALRLRSAFISAGCPSAYTENPPHISLATFEKVSKARLIKAVETFAAKTPPLTVSFLSLGIFPGVKNVVFLAPVVTKSLLETHESFHAILQSEKIRSATFYLPGKWVPHCTITKEDDIETSVKTMARIHSQPIFTQFRLSRVQIFKLNPAVTSMGAFELSGHQGF